MRLICSVASTVTCWLLTAGITLCGKSKWASLCISQTKIFDTIIHIKLFVLKYANERDRWTDNTTHCWHNATFLWLVFASVWQYWHQCKTMLQNIWRRPLLASPCTFLKNLLRHYAICASNHDEYTCAVGILVSSFNKEKVQVKTIYTLMMSKLQNSSVCWCWSRERERITLCCLFSSFCSRF